MRLFVVVPQHKCSLEVIRQRVVLWLESIGRGSDGEARPSPSHARQELTHRAAHAGVGSIEQGVGLGQLLLVEHTN